MTAFYHRIRSSNKVHEDDSFDYSPTNLIKKRKKEIQKDGRKKRAFFYTIKGYFRGLFCLILWFLLGGHEGGGPQVHMGADTL